ncbi:DUF3096 domain-containing protein [Candidatus Pacearchaeota archaeon]|nr:DUF3096 domain-containing protein [Candidatus Pacearchaeota archaeon]
MVTTTLAISAILSIIFGILILVWPRFLNYFVALWLIITGLLNLLGGYIVI